MNVNERIKKNNGSALTIVLFMLFLLSVSAIAVITITGSELGMSVMTSDNSKALMAAQAGAEEAAQVLDVAVAEAQENARVLSSKAVQDKIDDFKHGFSLIEETAFKDVLEISEDNEIIVLDTDKLNEIYEDEYKFQFNILINDWFVKQTDTSVNSDAPWDNSESYYINGADSREGIYRYADADTKTDAVVQSKIGTPGPADATTSILITSTGEYNSNSGSTYKRKIRAEFSLLTDTKGSTSEIPISYGKLTKVRLNKNDKPIILQDKALIAGKNIISVNGNVNVTGNVICFGTIPIAAADTDMVTSDGYAFGGLMAGITQTVWNNTGFGDGSNSLKKNIEDTGAFNLPYGFTNYPGTFSIDGSVGTLSYVHTLYGSPDNYSRITVTGDTFARSVKVENKAHMTKARLRNVYITDDMRIDANNSDVKVGAWNADGTPLSDDEGMVVGLSTGAGGDKYSSSVSIAGDSTLDIKGSVYIGGSTFYNQYTDSADKMYMSGMSIQKSGSLPAQAFEMSSSVLTPTAEEFPGNVFYLYDNNKNTDGILDPSDYININDQYEQQKLIWAVYNKKEDSGASSGINMMTGSKGIPNPLFPGDETKNTNKIPYFNVLERAMHFKYIWDRFWKSDFGYYAYLNSGDITISTISDNGNNKLKGWCWGAVAANFKVYGPYGDTEGSFSDTSGICSDKIGEGKSKYAEYMKLFIPSSNALTAVEAPKKLTGNSNASDDCINLSALVPDQYIQTKSGTFIYNGSSNTVLSNDFAGSGSNNPSEDGNGYMRGIVYSRKDIYVKAGTKFKGILIAEGNIVFLGGADIKYDEDVIDILMSEEPKAGSFFKYRASDIIMNDDNAIIQTIKKADVKNIKIVSWKEI